MKKFISLTAALILSASVLAQEGIYSLQLSHPTVNAIAQDANGYIWFGTSRGLNRFNGTTYTAFYASADEGKLNNDNILALYADSDGTLWIGTECGLNWLKDGKFQHFNSTVYDPVYHIEENSDSTVVISGRIGNFVINKNTLAFSGHDSGPDSYDKTVSFRDRDGGLWEADEAMGWKYTAKGQAYRSVKVSDKGERISHLVFDPEGYLWMRLGEHLASYAPDTYAPVWEDTRHSCGGLFLNELGNLEVLEDGWSVVEYRTHNGIPHIVNKAATSSEVYSIAKGRNDHLWLSEESTLKRVTREKEVTRYTPGIPFSYLFPSPGDGRVFLIGIRDGLMEVMDDGSVVPFGPGFQNVSALLMARDGTFWIGTYNDGLIHFDEHSGETERFSSASGVMVGDVKSLSQDKEGHIWISTATHLSRYNPWNKTLTPLQDNNFREGRFYDLLSSTEAPDGKVLFGGSGILTIISPEDFRPAEKVIPLKMESITVNDNPVPANTRELDLRYDDNTLSFRFAGIDFQNGAMLNYNWQLEGYEKRWHTAASTPLAIYTHLPAGHYTFRARVREQNGEWSSSVITLPIIVRHAPWLTPFMQFLYWLIGIGILIAGIVAWTRIRILQDKVASLTSADLEESAPEVKLSASEETLLRKMHAFLGANLDNTEWDISAMAQELGMSYSSFYAKVTALTGHTPKAYVTGYRMNIARKLLLEGYNVSEVADKVGSSSPSNFSREFKNHFGYPPSQANKQ